MLLVGRLPVKILCGSQLVLLGAGDSLLGQFGADFGFGLAFHEGFGLGEEIGEQNRVVLAEGILGFDRGEEIAGDEFRALVDQLIEGVLAVGAGLAPDDGAGGIIDGLAVAVGAFAVGFHVALLKIGGEAMHDIDRREGSPRSGRRRNCCTRRRARRGSRADFFPAAWCGNVRPSRSAPVSSCSKLSMPMKTAMDRPMADQSEYRPPTQSQNSNMFCLSMPNLVTSFSLVERATKCLATAAGSLAVGQEPSLAVCGVGEGFLRGEGFGGDDEERWSRA